MKGRIPALRKRKSMHEVHDMNTSFRRKQRSGGVRVCVRVCEGWFQPFEGVMAAWMRALKTTYGVCAHVRKLPQGASGSVPMMC